VRKALALVSLGLLSAPALAAPVLIDSFDYPAGAPLSGQVAPNGQTWMLVTPASGLNLADPTIGAGSLGGGPGAPAGNSVLTDRSQVGSSRITLSPGTAPNSGTVYYSALVRVNDMAGLTNTTTGSFFAGLNSGSGAAQSITSAGAALMIHLDSDNASAYNLGIAATTANNDRIFDTRELTAGQTVFVVASYQFVAGADNDVARLWIDPDPALFAAGTPPVPDVVSDAAVTVGASTDNNQLASFFLRNNSVEPAQIQFDELRIGTSPADVVPEPGTFGILACAVVGLLRRRAR
jgi:hypothetical protein